jgi:hypothetical protein
MRIPRYQLVAHNARGEKAVIIRFVVFDDDAGEFPEFQTEDGREVVSIDDDLTFFDIEGVRFKKGGPHPVFD